MVPLFNFPVFLLKNVFHALGRPASEKRQGTKSRAMTAADAAKLIERLELDPEEAPGAVGPAER